MVGVYGGYNRELLQLVTTANPHIDNPNQIIAGDEIRFPTVEEPTGDSAATKKDE